MQLTSVFLTLVATAVVIAAPVPLVELAKRCEFVDCSSGNRDYIYNADYRRGKLAEGTPGGHDDYIYNPDYRRDELAEGTPGSHDDYIYNPDYRRDPILMGTTGSVIGHIVRKVQVPDIKRDIGVTPIHVAMGL